MVRDLRRLADTSFDLLVVGAGFYGAVAAWDATLRGLSVALIDKNDVGSGTSFNNLKTLHGGLRSLQALNFKQMRLFIRERRALARVAPHLVERLSFVIPTYAEPRRSALLMRVALMINDVVSHDRNDAIAEPELQLPKGYVVSREECLRLNPVIDPSGVRGGAVWHDYQMHNADRMTFSFVASAADKGAQVANYLAATRFVRDGAHVIGVQAQDQLSGAVFEIRAKTVLNAAGAWAGSLLRTLGRNIDPPASKLSRAMNLVTRRVVETHGCGGLASGRFLFVVPWREVSIVGTSHDAHTGTADTVPVTRSDVETFLADAREAFPNAQLTAADVRLIHRGLLPMVEGQGRHVRLLRESEVVDHRRDNVPGLVSMFGVRYTTARATAEQAIDAVFQTQGVASPPLSCTASTPVLGGGIGNKESFLRSVLANDGGGVSPQTRRRLALTYGSRQGEVLNVIRREPALGSPLGGQCAVTGAEIAYAATHESAVKLADALVRRTEAGSAGHPGDDAVARAAEILARLHGWDAERKEQEIREVEAFYRLPF